MILVRWRSLPAPTQDFYPVDSASGRPGLGPRRARYATSAVVSGPAAYTRMLAGSKKARPGRVQGVEARPARRGFPIAGEGGLRGRAAVLDSPGGNPLARNEL